MGNRIFIALLNDKSGGAEHVTKLLVNYFLERAFQVDIYFVTKSKGKFWIDYENRRNINLIRTRQEKESIGFGEIIKNIYSRRKTQYELAFTSHIYLNSLIGILRRFKIVNTKWFVSRDSHSYYLVNTGAKLKMYDLLIKAGYGNQDLIISQTNQMRQQLIINNKKNQRLKKITHVIKNPIDILNIKIDENLKLPKKSIITAGRLIKIKGFDLLIKAFALLENNSEFDLLILGEGPELQALKNLSVEMNVESNVKFLGHQMDVYSYFRKAELCVVSSLAEGFPNVLLQMMTQNNNVVSTLCADGIKDLVGVKTCKPNNVEELKKTMELTLKDSPNLENRAAFDKEIESRTVEIFVSDIYKFLFQSYNLNKS